MRLPQTARNLLWVVPFVVLILGTVYLAATVKVPTGAQDVQRPLRYGPELNPPTVMDLGHGMYCMSFSGGNISCVYAPDWVR
jgi:hypothetical protein